MEKINKFLGLVVLVVFLALGLLGQVTALAATSPTLGLAETYGVLSSTYTNTTAGTAINGDVGFSTGPAVTPTGVHPNYGALPPYATAGADQGIALSALTSQGCTFTFGGGAINLSTDTTHGTVGVYTPGVYCSTGAMDVGGPITLNGSGTYIFRPLGALTSTTGAIVTLSGGCANDVFWTPTQATTIATNTTFIGNIISDAGITIGANTSLTGRALAFSGTVTTDTNTITVPTCAVAPAPGTLNIIKNVVNDNGGIATASLFNLHVKLSGTDVSGSPAAGTTIGTSYSLSPNTYVVSEDINASYAKSFSGDCDINGNINIASGDNKTCTITNNDIVPVILPATINIVKIVINDNGRTKIVSDFPLFINGTLVISGITNIFAAPAAYKVTETTDSNYAQAFSGDCDASGNINLIPGNNKFCIITNNDIAPSSSSGAYISKSSKSSVPPLIDVVKVPSPLSLPNGPGIVEYTYTLSNMGTVSVSNITMTGDSCSPITLTSGDTDSDNKLDVSETWVYNCSKKLLKTHTNTVVATGWANDISATDIASATVVVGARVVPPLIHVTKIPSPLTLPAGGGMVTYTKKITNPGTVALSNVQIIDDKCEPVKYISGDINDDSKLDPTETWTYTCQTNLAKTTTNTVTVSGDANDLTARDFAIAHVVVAIPGLPSTGFPPEENSTWDTVLMVGITMFVFALLAVALKKRMI